MNIYLLFNAFNTLQRSQGKDVENCLVNVDFCLLDIQYSLFVMCSRKSAYTSDEECLCALSSRDYFEVVDVLFTAIH